MLDIVLIGSIAVDDTTLTLDIFLASRATGMVSVLVALRVIADANGRTELFTDVFGCGCFSISLSDTSLTVPLTSAVNASSFSIPCLETSGCWVLTICVAGSLSSLFGKAFLALRPRPRFFSALVLQHSLK